MADFITVSFLIIFLQHINNSQFLILIRQNTEGVLFLPTLKKKRVNLFKSFF
jgi:hypothetical protein